MTVAITWSTSQGGAAVAEALTGGGNGVDHGVGQNGTIIAQRELWLRHNGANSITNCGFYIKEYSSAYGGDASAAADLAELIAWGDAGVADDFGGFQINMNSGDANPGDWPSVSSKQPTNGSAFFTGVGDSATNAVTLKTTMGTAVTSDGVIAGGGADDAQFFSRVQIPTNEDTPGVRQFDQVLKYTFTS